MQVDASDTLGDIMGKVCRIFLHDAKMMWTLMLAFSGTETSLGEVHERVADVALEALTECDLVPIPLAIFRRRVEENPDSPDALCHYALRTPDISLRRHLLHRAAKEDHPTAFLELAKLCTSRDECLHIGSQSYTQSSLLERAVKLAPHDPLARVARAQVLPKKAQQARLLKDLNKIPDTERGPLLCMLAGLLGDGERVGGDNEDREMLLRRAMSEQPDYAPAYHDLARLLPRNGATFVEGVVTTQRELLEAALRVDPFHAPSLHLLGCLTGDVKSACLRAIASDPLYRGAYLSLALTLEEDETVLVNDVEMGRTALLSIADNGTKRNRARLPHFLLREEAFMQDCTLSAHEICEEALLKRGARWAIEENRLTSGHFSHTFSVAVTHDPTYAPASHAVGMALSKAEVEMKIRAFQCALSYDPLLSRAYTSLGIALPPGLCATVNGEVMNHTALFTRALTLDRRDGNAAAHLASHLFRDGLDSVVIGDATMTLQDLLFLCIVEEPDLYLGYYWLGRVSNGETVVLPSGDAMHSAELYRKAFSLEPHCGDAAYFLAKELIGGYVMEGDTPWYRESLLKTAHGKPKQEFRSEAQVLRAAGKPDTIKRDLLSKAYCGNGQNPQLLTACSEVDKVRSWFLKRTLLKQAISMPGCGPEAYLMLAIDIGEHGVTTLCDGTATTYLELLTAAYERGGTRDTFARLAKVLDGSRRLALPEGREITRAACLARVAAAKESTTKDWCNLAMELLVAQEETTVNGAVHNAHSAFSVALARDEEDIAALVGVFCTIENDTFIANNTQLTRDDVLWRAIQKTPPQDTTELESYLTETLRGAPLDPLLWVCQAWLLQGKYGAHGEATARYCGRDLGAVALLVCTIEAKATWPAYLYLAKLKTEVKIHGETLDTDALYEAAVRLGCTDVGALVRAAQAEGLFPEERRRLLLRAVAGDNDHESVDTELKGAWTALVTSMLPTESLSLTDGVTIEVDRFVHTTVEG